MLSCLNPIIKINDDLTLQNINQIRKFEGKKIIKKFSYFNSWTKTEKIFIAENEFKKNVSFFKCKKCPICKMFKRYDWIKRINLEIQNWKYCLFITLTFDKEHINKNSEARELSYWIRNKKRNDELPKEIKYFAVKEYGDKTGRKHYHMLIFSNEIIFNDLEFYKKSKRNNDIYTSKYLNEIWEYGSINSVQLVTSEAAFKYMLKYTTKLNNEKDKVIVCRHFGNVSNTEELKPQNLPSSLARNIKQKIRYYEKKLIANEINKKEFNAIWLNQLDQNILNLQIEKNKENENKFWKNVLYSQSINEARYIHNYLYFIRKSTEF